MPAQAKSLQITENYRSGMVRLRKQGQAEAKRIWRSVSPDDLDGTFNVGLLELTVQTLQREAARLSSAYLASFVASELGEPQNPPALSVWDKTFGGNPLREGLRSAVIKAKLAIKDGETPRAATNKARAVLVDDVGLFIDTAARESLRQGMEMDDRIVGYQRALKGTCGACSGSTSYEAFSENAPVVPLNVHPNCFPAGTEVSGPKARAATTRWYEGDLVELRTRDNLLACTPNHPILTLGGWIGADELREGDDVIRCFGQEWSEGSVGPDDDEGPTLIEEVAIALRRSGSVATATVPVASEDFHGDGISNTSSDVNVVWTDRFLKDRGKASSGQDVSKPSLCLRCANLLTFAGLCGFAALSEGGFTATNSFVSSFGIAAIFFGSPGRIAQADGIAHSADKDAFLGEDAMDGSTAKESVPSSKSLLRFASEIQTDKLLTVRRVPFRGHVYNLQTDDGWYIANGMIVHNCQCVAEPAVQPRQPKSSPERRTVTAQEQTALERYVRDYEIPDQAILERLIAERGGKTPETLWRWMDSKGVSDDVLAAIRPGEYFRHQGFVSTSANRNIAGDLAEWSSDGEPIIFEIVGGARGLNVDAIIHGEQSEWLLQRGTNFIVRSQKRVKFKWRSLQTGEAKETAVRLVRVEVA